MTSRIRLCTRVVGQLVQKRSFSTSQQSHPLKLLRQSSSKLSLCDYVTGFRTANKHWVFGVSAVSDPDKAPNLRTMNIQRVTDEGIDFITKKGSHSQIFALGAPVSILHTIGQYVPGELVQQWRAEGVCKPLELYEIIGKASDYTVSGIIASTRLTKEHLAEMSEFMSEDMKRDITEGRSPVETTEYTEVIQRARNDLANGDVTLDELEESIDAYRFCPTRVELMVGGPDQVMWNRWEWQLSEDESEWSEPKHILPH